VRKGNWPLQIPTKGDKYTAHASFTRHDRDREAHILEVMAVTPTQRDFIKAFLEGVATRTKGTGELDSLIVEAFDGLFDTEVIDTPDGTQKRILTPLDISPKNVFSAIEDTYGFDELGKAKKIWVKGVMTNELRKAARHVDLDPKKETEEAARRIDMIISSLPEACEDLAA